VGIPNYLKIPTLTYTFLSTLLFVDLSPLFYLPSLSNNYLFIRLDELYVVIIFSFTINYPSFSLFFDKVQDIFYVYLSDCLIG
jgi:hypothetical protein